MNRLLLAASSALGVLAVACGGASAEDDTLHLRNWDVSPSYYRAWVGTVAETGPGQMLCGLAHELTLDEALTLSEADPEAKPPGAEAGFGVYVPDQAPERESQERAWEMLRDTCEERA